jgi:transposase-like protein
MEVQLKKTLQQSPNRNNYQKDVMSDRKVIGTKVQTHCPYCNGPKIIKRGQRTKKYEVVQLYYCTTCKKKFTPITNKNRSFPLRVILESISKYNRLDTLSESSEKITERYGIKVNAQNISNWMSEYSKYLPYSRMRDYINKNYAKKDIIVSSKMFHKQIYDFVYHRAKTDLILSEDFKNYKFSPLQVFLELIIEECPHQIFKESMKRASEYKDLFDLNQVKLTPKENIASQMALLVMQTVTNNRLRHEKLQEFMLLNDSVTVATEVPILLDWEDVLYYNNTLGFNVPVKLAENETITGHIDIVQIRNGNIHLLDYKPGAKRVKPVEQLTIYALAMSRLTGIRLYHFKCAWFDKEHYYEFFPLHVVYKKKKRSKGKKVSIKKPL